MTNDTRTSDDIERDIVDERAQMSDTINDLQRKFSVDAILNDLGDMFNGQAGGIGRSISNTVGRNPAAVALVGVGLAWLFLGQDRKHAGQDPEHRSGSGSDLRRHRRAHAQRRDSAPSAAEWSNYGVSHDDDRFWYGEGEAARGRRFEGSGSRRGMQASSGSKGVMGTVRDATNAVGDTVSHAADRVGHAASDLTERLSHGLDDLSEEAKERVLSARHAAHEARLASQAALKKGSQAAANFFEDQPLVVGALAVAFGAAIGGVLPHSRIEDDTMGDSSDRLFADAQALFREERDKAVAAAKGAASDLKGEIKDVGEDLEDLLPEGKTVGDVIVGRASDAATRVLDRATGQNEDHDRNRSKT